VTADDALLTESAEDLFEDAPCGYLATRLDGTILRVNRTFEAWTGLDRAELVDRRRFQDLLSAGGRIYHETHYAPLLRMQGAVREIAVEIVRADGSHLPALVNAVLRTDDKGRPRLIRTTVFDATDRRRYEQELLRRGRRERDIAERLQRSFLSGALPAAPGLEVAVGYRPAEEGTDVGGDFYDAHWLREPETLALVVGDVVGRGIDAAATMGQLRSAIRALGSTGLAPGALLEGLDTYARRHGVGEMTTLVCAELDLRTRELCFSCAGHPPPVVLAPGEPPAFAWEGRSRPVDAYVEEPAPRTQAALALPAGAAVVLYTDGLVERRGETIDEGLDALLADLAGRDGEPAAELADGLMRRLRDAAHPDDVCVLVARLSG
jgi:PAS domain S-box-containing protein